MESLDDMARDIIDTNSYMTLGTTDPDHRPRVSPVFFTHHGYRDFYWVSVPDAHHSRNVDARPDVAIVIFDSTVPVFEGRAVYVTARAAEVGEEELPERCAEAFATPKDGVRFEPARLSGAAALRLYRATASTIEVHLSGGDPRGDSRHDHRRGVSL